ncbi:leucine-rich repeat-containing protein 59-like isoform X2 [Babylonia areolata]|uniref:leucine-rich repeat-containing protein 59-like isoform X2 n=1 Tax=Babylonia areolata TaxID=304850 RepID=UPI003FD13A6A
MSVGNLKDQLDGSEIDLSLNNLTEVPVEDLAKIPEATHLDLSCNLITSLPDDFCTLVHLVKLDLSKNKLKELPANFGRLVNLQFLDLMGNDLTELPPSFGDLGCLEWLDLKGNPLVSDLMEKAGDCLNEQQCQECAKNVIGFLKKVDSLTEEKEETPRKSKWIEGSRIADPFIAHTVDMYFDHYS